MATPGPLSVPMATPNPVQVDIVDQVKAAFKEFTEIRGIQTAFSAFMVHDAEVYDETINSLCARVTKTFKEAPNPESVEGGVKHIVSVAGGHTNPDTIDVIFQILDKLVSSSVLSARIVCESLLDSDKMTYRNSKFWIQGFVLIRKIIGGVDYKGVREIMKTCLDKLPTFPEHVPPTYLPQLNAIVRLLQHIFDRTACLLPAYFIVNEVLKNYPENRSSQHWSIGMLMAELVDSFKPTAQMVSIVGRSTMLPVVEHAGHSGYMVMSWKLDPTTLRFVLKGNLPYDKDLLTPQDRLLRYILEQPYSRDMACAILGLQKQHKVRCSALEDSLVDLIVCAMERAEIDIGNAEDGQLLDDALPSTLSWWQHLSTQLIFFVLFQFASFPHIVRNLHAKILDVKVFKGRDFLMWILLQFISGSIQKNPLSDFIPVLRLFDALYPEKEPLPIPDMSKAHATAQLSATCIWIHILKKAQTENHILPRPLPSILQAQFDYLQSLVQPSSSIPLQVDDYRVALLCNAYSTNQEYFSRPMAALVEAIHGSANSTGSSSTPSSPTTPLSVQCLDSLTVHTKMSLIHNIVTHIMKVAQSKSNQNLSPALIETYARLLVYMEIESLGIKGFITQLLPAVYKSQAWGILHTLLEMFCYRLHHIQPHYRVQLLCHLHNLAANAMTNSAQLHLCIEMTSLRLITGFNSVDMQSQLSRIITESKQLVSVESEELNRALVLTIARAIHVTGADSSSTGTSWFREILNAIMQSTPHSWASHTLQCFPPVLAEYFQQNSVPRENKQQLKNMVDEQYRNWNAMLSNEHELIEHFSMQGTPALFLCIVWKMLIDTERVNPLAFKVIERIGPKGLSSHLRKFCDYLICELGASRSNTSGNSSANQSVYSKMVDTVMEMVWKYNIVPFDRFILCLALRTNEGNDAHMCLFVMNLLMFKNPEFQNRVTEFVAENSPEHWTEDNWHDKHKNYHTKFPEVFLFEDSKQNQLPVFFGNVCLRFLPVLDILLHRLLEINSDKAIEMTLQKLGSLYKFHDRPITYLYNTLHYYEMRLREKPLLKKKLVTSILGHVNEKKSHEFTISDAYNTYISDSDENTWTPDVIYYVKLVSRFVDVLQSKQRYFSGVDWRYHEFPNPAAHVLHATCVEIMALPVVPSVAGEALLSVVTDGRAFRTAKNSTIEDSEAWFNSAGLILVSLPDPYWLIIHDRLVSCVEKLSASWTHSHGPLTLFSYKAVYNGHLYHEYANLIAITHALWHHLGSGHLLHIQNLVTDRFLPIVSNEIQMLFICHLVAPFLQRFNGERPTMVCRLTIALYELLEKVDNSTSPDAPLEFMDVFCDLLYHIKYMFTGDIVKNEVEAKIRNLRSALQIRLRFITHLNIEDITIQNGSSSYNITQGSTQQTQQIIGPTLMES